MIQDRIPETRRLPTAAIPYGGDATDFAHLREQPRSNKWFDRDDGDFHICYMGTLLPLGFDTLRAVLAALAALRRSAPDAYRRTRLHFFGTSNQTTGKPDARVLPIANEIGVDDRVTEYPLRVDYLDALMLQVDASAILLMGSSEAHYTASKLYPALLSGRPLLAVYHSASTVAEIMSDVTAPPNAYLVTYSDNEPVGKKINDVADALRSLVENPITQPITWRSDRLEMFSARSLAGELAKLFDRVSKNSRN